MGSGKATLLGEVARGLAEEFPYALVIKFDGPAALEPSYFLEEINDFLIVVGRGIAQERLREQNLQRLFSYPDVVAVCGEPQFYDERRDILTNPTVVFEVLSPSTEAYDRGEKFLRYRTQLEALREYVLVSQHRPLVEHYVRQPDGSWSYSSANSLDEVVDLISIDCRLPLPEIYDRIVFPAGAGGGGEDRGSH